MLSTFWPLLLRNFSCKNRSEHRSRSSQNRSDPPEPFPSALSTLKDAESEHNVDIVFVHDLAQDHKEAWVMRGPEAKVWPTNVLPQRVPTARILAFEYDWSGATSIEEILKHDTLIKRARELRDLLWRIEPTPGNAKAPYTILMGHGYGGLICEQIMELPRDEPSQRASIDRIRGIVLFGTPHFRAGLAQWAILAAKRLKIPCAKGTKFEDWSPSREHLINISKIQEHFQSEFAKPGCRIACCFANPALPDGQVTLSPEWAILPWVRPIAITADQFHMTNFESSDDRGLLAIITLLSKWVDELKTGEVSRGHLGRRKPIGSDSFVDPPQFDEPFLEAGRSKAYLASFGSCRDESVQKAVFDVLDNQPDLLPNPKAILERLEHPDLAIRRAATEEALCTDSIRRAVIRRLENPSQTVHQRTKRVETHNRFVPFGPGRYFTGRRGELAKLENCLADESHYVPHVVALYGVGGVGKTQLAVRYAFEHSDFYDWVFFANATSVEALRSDFRQMHLQVYESIDKEEGNAVEKFLAWLASRKGRWLLILNNANHLQDVSPYISRLRKWGHVIITTKDQAIDENEFISAKLDVQSFSPEASEELLFHRSGLDRFNKAETGAAKKLLEDIKYLPLVVDSAAAHMSFCHEGVTRYRSLLDKYQHELSHQSQPPVSSHDLSVYGALEVNLREIDTRPDASALLCLLIFLNGAEVTEEFLTRGVTGQLSWGPNGEAITVMPQENYVPEALIELINNPTRLDNALKDLISLSIITTTRRSGTGRALTLHPLRHEYAKRRISKELRRKYCAEALMFLAHAFPADEYILEQGHGFLTRSFIPHIIYAYESFECSDNGLSVELLDTLASPDHGTWRLRPSEVAAKLVLDGDLTYGQGEPKKNAYLLAWVDRFLQTSSNIYLQARALSVRLVITYYESGNYTGGINACKKFLHYVNEAKETGQATIDELSNAEIGIIQSTLAELLVTEVCSDSDRFAESKTLLQSWSPRNPDAPSRKEKFVLGERSRILGKILKDHGEWAKSQARFKEYLDKYALKGTQPEGWSAGDLAHTLMEQGHPKEAEKTLRRYLLPRQGFQTPGIRVRDRRSDTVYLEMLLGESLWLQGENKESQELMQELLNYFLSLDDELWHFEKFRVAFVMTVLARIHHLKGEYRQAVACWTRVIDYCESKMDVNEQRGKWDRNSFMPLIAELSLSDCYFELREEDIGMRYQTHSLGLLKNANTQRWILGLGTYWLKTLMIKARKRDK